MLGARGRGGGLLVALANASRAVPTFAVLVLLVATPVGFGDRATVVALVLFAVPPLLTNAYVGVRDVDPEVREAARGMGMTRGQLLRRVELPLALPLVAAGVRTAAVQVVATATLAAYVGGGGLGRLDRRRLRPGRPGDDRGRRRARRGARARRRAGARRWCSARVTPGRARARATRSWSPPLA